MITPMKLTGSVGPTLKRIDSMNIAAPTAPAIPKMMPMAASRSVRPQPRDYLPVIKSPYGTLPVTCPAG